MSIKKTNRIIASAAVIIGGLTVLAPQAQATNGYFVYGFGPTSKGMAGAGTAYSTDAMAAATNVAGMAFVGRRADVDVTLFNPNREFDTRGAGTLGQGLTESGTDFFQIPNFGVNYPVGDKWTVGFTMNANGGMNTEYPTSVFQNFGAGSVPTGVDLAQALMALSITYKPTPNVAIGFAPVGAFQRFKAYGLEAFKGISVESSAVTGRGYEQSGGYGVRMGIQGRLNDYWSAGVSYQSRMYMQAFNKYRGLFADGGDFDIPQMINAGVALRATPKLTVALDWQWINYNEVDAIANSAGRLTTQVTAANGNQLGAVDGIGFGWEDMNVIKIGANYKYSDKLNLRDGVSHNDRNPYDASQIMFNILAPAVVRTHLTLGMEYNIFPNASVNLAYAHAFSEDFTGTDPNLGTQTVTHRMDQNEGTIGFSYKW